METQYYDMDSNKRGGRIETKIVCAVCYLDGDFVPDSEVKEKRNLKGKSPLPICRSCFDYNIAVPVSGGKVNNRQKAQQNKAEKKRRLDDVVNSGKRKGRKN